MKGILLLFFTPLLITVSTYAQNLTYEWTRHIGNSLQDYGRSVAIDPYGNVVSTGSFYDTIDVDPGPGIQQLISGGFQDTYIQKLDPNGNMIWGISITGTFSVVANEIAIDDNGYIYLTGSFKGTCDFDPGPGVFNISDNGLRDSYILKLDQDGSLIWAKAVGGSGFERSFGLAVDSEGSVYTSGYFANTVDFDPNGGVYNVPAVGPTDAYILKLDSLGDFEWVNSYGNDTISFALNVTCDINDDVIATGYYAHTMDFDPGPAQYNLASNGGNDMFIHKLTTNGAHIWTLSVGGNDDQSGRTIITDRDANVYISGGYSDTIDFNPGPGTDIHSCVGESDIYLMKLNASGIYQWTQTFGTVYAERARNVSVDTNGYVYLVGDFSDTIDFDFGAGTHELYADTNNNIFALKLGGDGTFKWAESFGGIYADHGYDIATDNNGGVYITGFFQDTVDFDPGIGTDEFYSNGNWDTYVLKLSQCIPTYSFISPLACNDFTSPSGNYFWTTSGNYIDTLINGNSCGEDSIIYITLTINTINTGISVIDDTTLQASAAGVTYQWLDCNNNFSPIASESGQSFSPTQNGMYAVEVTGGGCCDTSLCETISVIGIENYHANGKVNIYPNPTADNITIDFGGKTESGVLRVTDLYGHIVNQSDIDQAKTIEIVLPQDAGIYFLNIQLIDGGSFVQRIIKN